MRHPFVDMSGRWPYGTVPTPASLRRLDQYSSELVNGADGGEWSPASPIVVGFANLQPDDDLTRLRIYTESRLTGSVETVRGNAARIAAYSGVLSTPPRVGLVVVDTDAGAPTLEVPYGREFLVPFSHWSEGAETGIDGDVRVNDPAFRYDPEFHAARAVMGFGPKRSVICTVPLEHRGNHISATLVRVTFYFQIGTRPTSLPTNLPRFRVTRFDDTGDALKMHTLGSGYDSSGFRVDPSNTVDGYYSAGNVRAISYVPDQFHTAIQPGDNSFSLQWLDDDAPILPGTKGNAFLGAKVELSAISRLRSE